MIPRRVTLAVLLFSIALIPRVSRADDANRLYNIEDASGMFNERGFAKSNSFSLSGNEVINDFNGNLMYTQRLRYLPLSENGLHCDLSLAYNGNVSHVLFGARSGMNGIVQTPANLPEWILSINGIAVQTFNFENELVTWVNDTSFTANVSYTDDVAAHIEGYHKCYREISSGTHGVISILMGDGSIKELYSTSSSIDGPAYMIGGPYNTCSKDDADRGYLWPYSSTLSGYFTLFRSDGTQVLFKVYQPNFRTDLNCSNSFPKGRADYPRMLLPVKFSDQMGHEINLGYSYVDDADSIWGRPILASAGDFLFQWSPWDQLSAYNELIIRDSGTNFCLLMFANRPPEPGLIAGRSASWSSDFNHGLVCSITDAVSRVTQFTYRQYSRTYRNFNIEDVWRYYQVCGEDEKECGATYRFDPWRLWRVSYPDGGQAFFQYYQDLGTAWGQFGVIAVRDTIAINYDHMLDCQYGTNPPCFPCKKTAGFDDIGRDPFFLNIVAAVRRTDAALTVLNTDSLQYSWVDSLLDQSISPGDRIVTTRWFGKDSLSFDPEMPNQQVKSRVLTYRYFPEKGKFSSRSRDRGWALKQVESVEQDLLSGDLQLRKDQFWDTDFDGSVCQGTLMLDSLMTSYNSESFLERYEYSWMGDPALETTINLLERAVIDPWGIRSETRFADFFMTPPLAEDSYYHGSLVSFEKLRKAGTGLLLRHTSYSYFDSNPWAGYIGQLLARTNYLLDSNGSPVLTAVNQFHYLKNEAPAVRYRGARKLQIDPVGNTTYFSYPESETSVSYKLLAHDGTVDHVTDVSPFQSNGPFWHKLDQTVGSTAISWRREVDERGNLLWLIDPNGYRSEIHYDGLNRLYKAILPGGYKPTGKDGQIPPGPQDTSWSIIHWYDDDPDPDPVCVKQFVRVARDKPSQTSRVWFDGLARAILTESLGADGSSDSVVTEHDYAGRVCAVRDQLGHITTSAYDFLDRPVSTQFPDPAHSSDSVKYSVSNAATVGLTTLFSFPEDIVFIKECLDENGHVVREVTDVRGKLRLRQSYDSTNAIVTYFDYDDLGNLTRVIKPNGDEVRYKYNSFGQLIEEEAADLLDSSGTGNYGRITYEYDKNGNLIRKQDATLRAGSSSYTEKIYYDYDALDRITASGLEASQGSQSSKTPVSRYFYDQLASELSVGRLSLVFTSDLSSRSNYAERYHYDGRGRVKRQVNYFQAVLDSTHVTGTGWVYSCHGDSVVLRYTYDWADQLRSITYADGSIVRYDYDERGRLTKVGGAEPGEVDRYARLTHTRRDELESMEIGGAIQHLDYAYNERGWLQSINDGVSGGAAPDDLFGQRLYYYDHPYSQMPWPAQYNGNVFCQKLSIAGDEKRFAHRYDKSDRLRESLIEAFEFESFNYDGNGNITFASKFTTEGTIAKDYRYAAGTNKLTVADRQHWLVDDTLTYDHNGNVIRHSGKKARFYYDILNRLVKTEISGSWGVDTVWYGYSAGGERIYKEYFYHFRRDCGGERSGEEGSRGPGEGDSTSLWCTDTARTFTYYVLGQGKVLAEQTSPAPSGAARKFIYAGGTRIAMRDAFGKLHYYLSDHLGSTRVVIDSTGLLEDRYWYHSFGTLVSEQTSTNQAYRYTSKPLDKEGGLDIYYYGARYYDPELGRFLALDPAAGEYPSLSPYAYCANNPLRHVDPDGGTLWDIIDVAFAAMSVKDLVEEPSWENAGWATLDVAAIFPIVPSSGWFRRGADAASDAGKLLGLGNDAANLVDRGRAAAEKLQQWAGKVSKGAERVESHHMLPQSDKLRGFFKQAGLDIETFKVDLPVDSHRFKSAGGLHTLAQKWNEQWEVFFDANPNATAEQIIEQLEAMVEALK